MNDDDAILICKTCGHIRETEPFDPRGSGHSYWSDTCWGHSDGRACQCRNFDGALYVRCPECAEYGGRGWVADEDGFPGVACMCRGLGTSIKPGWIPKEESDG